MEVQDLLQEARRKGMQGSDKAILQRIANDPSLAAGMLQDSFLGQPKPGTTPAPPPPPPPAAEGKPRPAMIAMAGIAFILAVVLVVVILRKRK